MNMELAIESKQWKFHQTNRTWKDRQPIKLMKKTKLEGDGAFKKKVKRIKKVNLRAWVTRKKRITTEICLKHETKEKRQNK
jgi:hypothetical protein